MAHASPFPAPHADAPEPWVRSQGGLREVSLWERMLGRIRQALWRAAGKG